ncbi:DUF3883 domain-containing protein [Rhodovulum sp. DZ06]|uniref:DUF3883 domain-containing protein n=1 Tax=Rhodovulum sp. DZ06 TaxID=3425126 RepID=UPI003D331F98
MAGADWTDAENDLIVADYFAMLREELRGAPYNKTAHRKALMEHIERPNGSIEFKHQNISAVLQALNHPWIKGYKPRSNFQMPLADAVARRLAGAIDLVPPRAPGLAEAAGELFLRPAPTLRNEPPPEEAKMTRAVIRKFDPAAQDEANRALGKAGEERVLAHERAVLAREGRRDLAAAVRWVSHEDGDGAGYDIHSFTPSGEDRLIEVKTTNGWERAAFHVSANELRVSEENPESWRLMRIWNFARRPEAFELVPPLSRHVDLIATSYRAEWG